MLGIDYLKLILLSALFKDVFSAKILTIMLVPSPSHLLWYSKYIKALTANGHSVTYVGVYKIVPGLPNVRQITFDAAVDGLLDKTFMMDLSGVSAVEMSLWFDEFDHKMSKQIKKSQAFAEFLKIIRTEDFDLVVQDVAECMFMLGAMSVLKKDTPLIGVTPFGRPSWVLDVLKNPVMYPSHPHFLLPYGDRMTFFERVHNFLFYVFSWGIRQLYMLEQNKHAKDAFGNDVEPLEKILDRMHIIMVNVNNGVEFSYPKVPGLVHIGGLHIDQPKKLPEDIQKFLDNATHGVVYFSLGTNVLTSTFHTDKIAMLTNAFKQIAPVRVLWKWEKNEELPGKPDNVKVMKWIPQNDVLAHPNVRLFFTHSGLLSTQEALYHGVPVLGMPFTLDQHANIRKCKEKGMGENLDYDSLSVEILVEKLRKLMSDTKYKENAKKLSAIFRDTMENPREKAVFWTEYAIRHNGAPHLSLLARKMPWYENTQADVYLFLLLVLLYALFLVCKLLQLLRRRLNRDDMNKKTL